MILTRDGFQSFQSDTLSLNSHHCPTWYCDLVLWFGVTMYPPPSLLITTLAFDAWISFISSKDRQWDTATRLRTMSHGVGVSKALARDVKIAQSARKKLSVGSAKVQPSNLTNNKLVRITSQHTPLSLGSVSSASTSRSRWCSFLHFRAWSFSWVVHYTSAKMITLCFHMIPHVFDHWSNSLPPCG